MSMSDTLSLALCKIKNAQAVSKKMVTVPNSRLVKSVLDVLVEYGFIGEYVQSKVHPFSVDITLKSISKLQLVRISKPSLRRFAASEDIPRVMGGAALVVMSTSEGVMSSISAKKRGIGGEVLCFAF